MSSTYNVVGLIKDVNEIVSHMHFSNVVIDKFPTSSGMKDINIQVEDNLIDDFIELCEEYGINPLLV